MINATLLMSVTSEILLINSGGSSCEAPETTPDASSFVKGSAML